MRVVERRGEVNGKMEKEPFAVIVARRGNFRRLQLRK